MLPAASSATITAVAKPTTESVAVQVTPGSSDYQRNAQPLFVALRLPVAKSAPSGAAVRSSAGPRARTR